jgi:hypothetical protein
VPSGIIKPINWNVESKMALNRSSSSWSCRNARCLSGDSTSFAALRARRRCAARRCIAMRADELAFSFFMADIDWSSNHYIDIPSPGGPTIKML